MVLAAGAALAACDAVYVAETDHHRYPDVTSIAVETPAADLARRMGPPTQRRVLSTHEVWAYAIRCCNPGGHGIPAVHLTLSFDGDGMIRDWSYRDPVSGKCLAVTETIEEARRLVAQKCGVRVVELPDDRVSLAFPARYGGCK